MVAIGPKAQAVLLKYLARADDMHLFRPVDSEAKRLAEQEANRETPPNCGNTRGSNRVANPKRTAGEVYTVDAYRRAITRAAKKAKVEHWSPHRLRHTAATEIRRDFGLEAAQIMLGHSNAQVTQIYAERDQAKAAEVARRIG